jgi:hypothetical protein
MHEPNPSSMDLGIDHPLVTVRDHAETVRRYRRLGFYTSPPSYHPWGTVTSMVMFPRNFIELIGVADASKFGTGAVDGFCFGRFLGGFLEREQGVSLIALHSTDRDADVATLTARGLPCRASIDFRRPMVLPDGTADEAVVSLGIFVDESLPEVSHFICQQHKPQLIWVPGWQNHPNGARGIVEVSYLAADPGPLLARLQAFYGSDAIAPDAAGLTITTPRGRFRVMDRATAVDYFTGVELPRFNTQRPHAVAITVEVGELAMMRELLDEQNIAFAESPRGNLLVGPEDCGNVILEFVSAAPAAQPR